jgi:hypothetical protein
LIYFLGNTDASYAILVSIFAHPGREATNVSFAEGDMQLDKLRNYIADYTLWLQKERSHPRLYWWEMQAHFQAHWQMDTPNLALMYLQSLENSVTKRPWQEERWYPKVMMAKLIELEPMSIKLMFDDLFDETKQVQHRMDRCIFYCDTLLTEYRKRKPGTKENDHFHGDYRMISIYLAMRYPDTYVPYQMHWMQTMLQKLNSLDVPQYHDPERFFKVCSTLYKFLEKDGQALDLLQKKLNPKIHFTAKTLLPALDLCLFILGEDLGKQAHKDSKR